MPKILYFLNCFRRPLALVSSTQYLKCVDAEFYHRMVTKFSQISTLSDINTLKTAGSSIPLIGKDEIWLPRLSFHLNLMNQFQVRSWPRSQEITLDSINGDRLLISKYLASSWQDKAFKETNIEYTSYFTISLMKSTYAFQSGDPWDTFNLRFVSFNNLCTSFPLSLINASRVWRIFFWSCEIFNGRCFSVTLENWCGFPFINYCLGWLKFLQ